MISADIKTNKNNKISHSTPTGAKVFRLGHAPSQNFDKNLPSCYNI